MNAAEWIKRAMSGVVLVDTGFLDTDTRHALDREVRAGRLVKWRGHWFPIAGANWGVGPLKTCYGTSSAKAEVAP